MTTFKVGDKVAWTMLDGNVMTGTVQDVYMGFLWVKRVDGGHCHVYFRSHPELHHATEADWQDAIRFYTTKAGTRL